MVTSRKGKWSQVALLVAMGVVVVTQVLQLLDQVRPINVILLVTAIAIAVADLVTLRRTKTAGEVQP